MTIFNYTTTQYNTIQIVAFVNIFFVVELLSTLLTYRRTYVIYRPQPGFSLSFFLSLFSASYQTKPKPKLFYEVHPYIFWIPMAGYLMIRNSSKYLTECHSTVLEWLGRITLETYVLQFHVFMTQNVQHILVVLPGAGSDGNIVMKTLNMLLCGLCFVLLSYWARKVTVSTQMTVTELVTLLKNR